MKRIVLYTGLLCASFCGPRAGTAADAYCAPGCSPGACNPHCDGACRPAGYDVFDIEDEFDRYSSGLERWWRDIRECIRERRLLGYKRVQRDHHEFLFPECPPYCSPTFGHHQPRWRPFPPDCEYTWTTPYGQPAWPTPLAEPALLPLTPSTPAPPALIPQPAPPAEEQYFPQDAPLIQPSNEAPTAPRATAPQAPGRAAFLPARSTVDAAAFEAPVSMKLK